ncbi:uncharacterized protein LOC104455464 [Eucalyptus grandis]|uniref:uncharacterized protein LOC104455464 n=1 Tax=Eucalyptus grandis TaxID=71139 RepID=UPI00192EF1BC|nr:uncharacterized protein LOC104455464 [Eucalyptus grandis]
MGYFIGRRMPFKVVEEAMKKMWGPNLSEVMSNGKGLFMFRIPDREFRRSVLESGRITVARIPLVLQQWTPGLELRRETHRVVHVWVRLSNIPFSCWSAHFIGRVASALGKPLYVDKSTEQVNSLTFARVCIEITADQPDWKLIETTHNAAIRPGGPGTERVDDGPSSKESEPYSKAASGNISQQIRPSSVASEDRGGRSSGAPLVPFTESAMDVGQTNSFGGSSPLVQQVANLEVKGKEKEQKSQNLNASLTPYSEARQPCNLKEAEDETSNISSKEDGGHTPRPAPSSGLSEPTRAGSSQDQLLLLLPDPPGPSPMEDSKATRSRRRGAKRKGIMNPVRRAEIRKFAVANKLCLIGLFETKVPEPLFGSISSNILRGWNWIANYDFAPRGRVWIGWDPATVSFELISSNDQAIHGCLKGLSSNFTCCVSAIYGEHSFMRQRPLWSDLINCDDFFQDYAWIVAGDFNAIKDPSDRVGSYNAWIPCFDDFKLCLDQTELEDLRYSGLRFTWSTSAGANRKMRKIDRVLVNSKWRMDFSYSEASFLNPGISDHTPMVVRVVDPCPRRKPFKYFDFWVEHPDFHSTVLQVWDSQVWGVPMFKLVSKLKLLKSRLKDLNLEAFSDISLRTLEAREALRSTQHLLQLDPENIPLAELEKGQRRAFIDLHGQEESTVVSDPDLVPQVFLSFFSDLLAPRAGLAKPDLQELTSLIRKPLSDSQVYSLASPVSDLEVKKTLFSLAKGKAPSPDGFTAEFFKSNWDIVGPLVIEAVKDFFSSGCLLKEVNATILALIPKVPNACEVNDRPIACCNTIYKLITKILANRIAPVPQDIVNPSQNAFVKGRRIRDNILLAQELFAGFHLDPYLPRCAVKVDFRKAYDTVDWDFLELTLTTFRFPPWIIRRIMACVRTPRFSISINGELHGFFPGDWKSAVILKRSLDIFPSWSGLLPNKNKSDIFLSGGDPALCNRILLAFGFQEGKLPIRYLGVPIISKRLSKADCTQLIDRITARARSWSHRFLSFAGRLQLIRSCKLRLENCGFLLPPLSVDSDHFVWRQDSSGAFSVASAWNAIRASKAKAPWTSFVWDKDSAPQFQFLLWLITKNDLPTQSLLLSYGRIDYSVVFSTDVLGFVHGDLVAESGGWAVSVVCALSVLALCGFCAAPFHSFVHI